MKREMISKSENISLSKQCELLSFPRSSLYYTPRDRSELNLTIMRLIDEIYQENPTMGSRRMSKEISKTHKIKVGGNGKLNSS